MSEISQNHPVSMGSRTPQARKLLFGILLTLLGGIFLLDNIGILSPFIKNLIFSWQMLLIIIGLLSMASHKGSITGIVLLITGIFFLLPEIFHFSVNFTKIFIPVLLILLGCVIIFRRKTNVFHHPYRFHETSFQNNSEMRESTQTNNYLDILNIFSGNRQNIITSEFKGGKITNIFGGSELDFTNSQLCDGVNVLDLLCIFGGVTIIIPSDWQVRIEVVSILGGFADKRYKIPDLSRDQKVLVLKGLAFFGGGEVKSYK
jgi:predicted membrane protein